MTDDDEILAAEYVLGLTEPDAVGTVEARLAAEPALRAAVTLWEARLAEAAPREMAAPPPDLWSRIERKLDEGAAAPATRTVHAEEGVWEALLPGVERKMLHVDAAGGRIAYLIRMKAGAALPRHRHPADEHCVVLEGELQIGDLVFGAGAYQLAREGETHPRIRARTDTLFFIQGAA